MTFRLRTTAERKCLIHKGMIIVIIYFCQHNTNAGLFASNKYHIRECINRTKEIYRSL